MKNIEVCISPALFGLFNSEGKIIVVVDILRATSTICTAVENGVKEIIPVPTLDEAKELKEKGFFVAAERNAIKVDFADIGNSPDGFSAENIGGKSVVYSTTNGTQAIKMAEQSSHLIMSSFLNLSATVKWIQEKNLDVLILCSGWKKRFNLEDSVFAGALCDKLIQTEKFATICDSALACIDLWNIAKTNLDQYLFKASHRERLKGIIPESVFDYCYTIDVLQSVPILKNGVIVKAE